MLVYYFGVFFYALIPEDNKPICLCIYFICLLFAYFRAFLAFSQFDGLIFNNKFNNHWMHLMEKIYQKNKLIISSI